MADIEVTSPSAPDVITIVPESTETSTITISYPDRPVETITVQETLETISIVTVGVPGPPGEVTNVPESIQSVASSILGGHRIVRTYDGVATYADNVTAYDGQLGMTVGAVEQGSTFRLYTSGVIVEPSWSLSPGPVFLGTNGLITQTKPSEGVVYLIGNAISPTSISLQFQQLYKRG